MPPHDWSCAAAGNLNSCCFDSAVFSLFAFSTACDRALDVQSLDDSSLPQRGASARGLPAQDQRLRELLRTAIVNPLRSSLYVPIGAMRDLRLELQHTTSQPQRDLTSDVMSYDEVFKLLHTHTRWQCLG